MEFYTEIKLKGDAYGPGFSSGLTLTGSATAAGLTVAEKNENRTIYTDSRGYRLEAWHSQRGNVTDCKTVFCNDSEFPVTIEMISSFAIKGIMADRIYRIQSFWSAEGRLLCQNLVDLNMEPSWTGFGVRNEKFGQIGSMPVRKWFPFIALEDTHTGTFIGVQLYCASSWQMEVFRTQKPLNLCGGLADRDFGHWFKTVAPGERFETPRAVIAQGDSLEQVCDRLVKAQTPHIAEADRDMPVIFNEFCTTWGNPTLDNLQKTAEKLDGSGVKYLVIDAGWYKVPDLNWGTTIGDWNPSKELFPNGIKEAAELIRSHGLIPGLWFEMEVTAENAEAYQKTEHLLKQDGIPITVGSRRFWNMCDPWVIDYLSQKVIGQLQKNKFGYVKIDYNENIGVGCDGAESPGEGLRRQICASQDFFRKISRELPEIVIENCSSGGHRLEPSMMELVSQASFSDAHECRSIPIIAANLHRVIRPEQSQIWAVLQKNADIHRLHYLLSATFLGRMCLSGPVFELEDWQWQEVCSAIGFYNTVHRIIRDGYTKWIISTPSGYLYPEGWQGVLRVLDDKALLVVHTFKEGANPPVDKWTEQYHILEKYGDSLNGDFQAAVSLLGKNF